MQLVQVEFDHVALKHNSIPSSLLHPLLDNEQLFKCTGHDTWVLRGTLNRVSFTGAGLTVGEQANVVAVNGTLHQHLCVFEYLFLRSSLTKACIKRVLFLFVPFLTLEQLFLQAELQGVLIDNGDYRQASNLHLIATHGPNPAEHSNLSLHVLNHVVQLLPDQRLMVILRSQVFTLFPQLVHLGN